MHCLFVGGVWNICLQMVLRALWVEGIRDAYGSLFEYVQRWRFPKRLGNSKLHELFANNIRKNDDEAILSWVDEHGPKKWTALARSLDRHYIHGRSSVMNRFIQR